jgi:intracellular septation protein
MKFLYDFFPILLFFIAYKTYDIFVATAVAIAASIVQVVGFWLKHRRFENMHLITMVLIVTLGGATLLLQERVYFMWKPTAVNWLFAIAFIGSHFIGEKTLVERMMSQAITVPQQIWKRLNVSWILFFIVMGTANLYVANFFFIAESALNEAAGFIVELDNCGPDLSSTVQQLCEYAKIQEENWVNFKLFGMMGLTFVFVIGQAFYLARHIPDEEKNRV